MSTKNFKGKNVLVTGTAGSIGSELCRQLATFGVKQLILFDNAETPMHNLRLELEGRFPELDFVPVIGDVRQRTRLDFAFRHYHPQVVFHAAAYKHVPLMEENPCEAVLVNTNGSRNVADKCKIEYTGLRPGEKLYEEVLSDTENTLPTPHERIRIAKVREYGYDEVLSIVKELEDLSRKVEIPDMVKLMKRTVPEFISRNSRFEIYDKQ